MEPSVHITTGTEKVTPELCAGTLVVSFAEEVVGSQIGTLDVLIGGLVLLAAVDSNLCSAVVDRYLSVQSYQNFDISGETVSLLDYCLDIYL